MNKNLGAHPADQAVLFHEEQRFPQPWFGIVLIGSWLLAVGICGYGLYIQLVLGRPWGNNPVSDRALLAINLSIIAIVSVVTLPFIFCRLTTEVRRDGLYLRFFPLHRRFHRIPLDNLKSLAARDYSPIAEYGGWGIRWGISGKAYNVRGRRGVQLRYAGKRRDLLIGSQRADELAAAIRQILATHTHARSSGPTESNHAQ